MAAAGGQSTSSPVSLRTLNDAVLFAAKKLGLQRLKSQQEEALSSFLRGHDVFVSLPTGFGKSAIFQSAPFAYDFFHNNHDRNESSFAIVVMPLKSLIQDQLNSVQCHGIEAEDISGGIKDEVQAKLSTGHFSLLFSSPEFLTGDSGRDFLKSDYVQQRLCGLFVDESHCVTKWGQSSGNTKAFRSSYAIIGELRSCIPHVPMVALTATATKDVRFKVVESLAMQNFVLIIESPDKPNLKHVVLEPKTSDYDRMFRFLIDELEVKQETCDRVIVYCHARKAVSELFALFASELPGSVKLFNMYHTNTEDDVQDFIIQDFGKSDGQIRILFATIAFGMGVDVKGVHTSIVLGKPSDMDDYLQMAGRVGRDGKSSVALLVSYPGDQTGRSVTQSVKAFVHGNECRRNILRENFGSSLNIMPMHNCCDICTLQCLCGGVSCSGDLPHFEAIARQSMGVSPGESSEELPISIPSARQLDMLRQNLENLRDDLVQENPDFMYSGKDIASRLPQSTIDKILMDSNVQLLRSEFMRRYCFLCDDVARRTWMIYLSALDRSELDAATGGTVGREFDSDSEVWSEDEFAEAVAGSDSDTD